MPSGERRLDPAIVVLAPGRRAVAEQEDVVRASKAARGAQGPVEIRGAGEREPAHVREQARPVLRRVGREAGTPPPGVHVEETDGEGPQRALVALEELCQQRDPDAEGLRRRARGGVQQEDTARRGLDGRTRQAGVEAGGEVGAALRVGPAQQRGAAAGHTHLEPTLRGIPVPVVPVPDRAPRRHDGAGIVHVQVHVQRGDAVGQIEPVVVGAAGVDQVHVVAEDDAMQRARGEGKTRALKMSAPLHSSRAGSICRRTTSP